MARVKRGTTKQARHKKVIKQAKGARGRSEEHLPAPPTSGWRKNLQYAYRDRKVRKRTFRALWIQRINAGAREHGLTYSQFMNGLSKAGHRARPQGAGGHGRPRPGRLQDRRRGRAEGARLSAALTPFAKQRGRVPRGPSFICGPRPPMTDKPGSPERADIDGQSRRAKDRVC